MAKRAKVRDYDQFIVRLPDGMRDRIKVRAERAGMSMNEAIVWCLEEYFPAPRTLEQKLDELATMAALLKSGGDAYAGVDRLIGEIHETVAKIYEGKLEVAPDFRARVSEQLSDWEAEKMENAQEAAYNPFEDDGGEAERGQALLDKSRDDSDEPFG